MDLIQIYQCFCDRARLRILHLLGKGFLCVRHLQKRLGQSQVKISRHLACLRARSMVQAERRGSWMIYSLPTEPGAELEANPKCLQTCPDFRADLRRRGESPTNCCEPAGIFPGPKRKGV